MSFNPDINEKLEEVTFSRKSNHLYLTIKGKDVTEYEIQKHLGMFLYSKHNFKGHTKMCSIRLVKE